MALRLREAVPLAYPRIFRAMAMLLLAFLVGGRVVYAQATTSVRGTVTDPSGSAVVGANVVLANADSKTERDATTGTQGEYQFLFLPPGTYTLSVTATGFARSEQTGLQLLVNTPATANVQLKLGQTTESIKVTSEAPALNLVDASLGNSFNETQVRQIPLEGRNVPDLLSLQAGVAYTGSRSDLQSANYKDQDTRSGAVNGARSDQSNISLDGVDVNDQSSGYAFTSVLPVTLDSVEEFRVTTTNYGADQGEGSGAQVVLVTKSGTNNFHGSLYEYNRNTPTSANDYLVKIAENRIGLPNKPLKLIRNIFGGSIGGPIQKDRLFFFANYEGTREREEHTVLRNIPTASLRDGVLLYQCQDPTACTGGSPVTGISGTNYPVQTGFFALGPTQIKNLDPLNIGPSSVMLKYFNQTYGNFTPNDPSVGDGFNYEGFRFRAPFSLDNNAVIARIDYHLTADAKHTLFWRGALQNLSNPQEPFLPGSPAEQTLLDHSKGFVVGYTAVLSSSLANTFHWGFTRQSTAFVGNNNQPWNTFNTLDQGINYSHSFQVPVHNLLDDFSWTKAGHTLQFGANVGFVRDPRVSLLHSFSVGKGATFWMFPVGFANTFGQSPLDPVNGRFPEPASSTAYDFPMLGLLGMVSLVNSNNNYDRQGNPLLPGAPVKRNWGLDWYEFYGQDSWRIKRNLTLTYGLRWSLFPPPWEVNGFQASPVCSNAVAAANGTPACPPGSLDLGKYFNQNLQNMQRGLGYADAPLISFGLGGPVNNGPGFYHFEKTDFSPRISVAYSPRPHSGWLKTLFGEGDKTVIRAGFSRVYDRAGMQLLNTFDANAPAGLSATLQNPCCIDGAGQVARITDLHVIPTVNAVGNPYLVPASKITFPVTPKPFGEAITWGIDQSLKTPHAYAIDFSIGRQLPDGFSLQLSYVGRLGRRLLTQRDLMQPLDLVDPKSGIDYFKAATAISKLAQGPLGPLGPTKLTPSQFDQALGPTVAYWTNLLNASGSSTPGLAPGATAFVMPTGAVTTDIAQAAYALYVTSGSFAGDEVVGLGNVDLFGSLKDNASTPNSYYFNGKTGELLNQQLTTNYAWSSIGRSNYNALQANLRKQFRHGVQFDLNYTYSKSIDFTSGATRLGFSGTANIGAPGSRLVNAFSPSQVRAVSDFDTTHQINVNWIAELPFGRGRSIGRNASGVVDAFIGGWQLSGLARWTTGFPFTVDNGQFWATNWDEQGSGQLIAIPKTGAFKQPDGTVSVFPHPTAALNDFVHPFPGQSGSRNVLRGDGFAGWDMNLSKRWKMPWESHSLQFRWEVYNVPNLKRFNVLPSGATGLTNGIGDSGVPTLQQVPSAFGDYAGLLTSPRVMQFALRYEF
ncbi:MAG TPA: carboxypeptidase-like regulatory domain-containing protein [Candidatus Acidoferrum sp.]|nr:carboxypeptidase-like regulatory domain-containing protein [Candidatus Acidoferrum sp.]